MATTDQDYPGRAKLPEFCIGCNKVKLRDVLTPAQIAKGKVTCSEDCRKAHKAVNQARSVARLKAKAKETARELDAQREEFSEKEKKAYSVQPLVLVSPAAGDATARLTEDVIQALGEHIGGWIRAKGNGKGVAKLQDSTLECFYPGENATDEYGFGCYEQLAADARSAALARHSGGAITLFEAMNTIKSVALAKLTTMYYASRGTGQALTVRAQTQTKPACPAAR